MKFANLKLVLMAAAAMVIGGTAMAQSGPNRKLMKERDGYMWYRYSLTDTSGANYVAAFDLKGNRLTPNSSYSIRYREEGFFDLVERVSPDQPLVHYLYDLRGRNIVWRSMGKNVIKIYPEEKLIVGWCYGDDYEAIEESIETFSYDGTYYAKGDYSYRPEAFNVDKEFMSKHSRKPVDWTSHKAPKPREVAMDSKPQQEHPTARPTHASEPSRPAVKPEQKPEQKPEARREARPEQKPEGRPEPRHEQRPAQREHQPAEQRQARPAEQRPARREEAEVAKQMRPIYASRYVSGPGTNPANGLVVEADDIQIDIEVYDDHLVENGYMARYDKQLPDGSRQYVGGFVGMKTIYRVSPNHRIVKELHANGPAGPYSYVYELTPAK